MFSYLFGYYFYCIEFELEFERKMDIVSIWVIFNYLIFQIYLLIFYFNNLINWNIIIYVYGLWVVQGAFANDHEINDWIRMSGSQRETNTALVII